MKRYISSTYQHLNRAFSSGKMPHLPHQPSIRSSQAACDLIFDYLKDDDTDNVAVAKLYSVIRKTGIQLSDPRLKETMSRIASFQRSIFLRDIPNVHSSQLDVQHLTESVHENIVMLHRIIQNDFVIPKFDSFCNEIDAIYERCRENEGGEVASYIPQLARFDPNLWGVAVCTVDGQRHFCGDTAYPFCLQSTSKPINYALALTELGPDEVHGFVGFEPSGVSFNTITLNQANKPHNPLINAGAIVCCSLISQKDTLADRFDYVMQQYRRLAGNEYLGFSNSTFLSERETADRNFALGHYMKENKCFPPGADLMDTLDFYFQLCSVEVTCESASVMAATLANGGICPLTGERVFSPEAVRDTLSLMHSCGMYDYSGQFAFKCGLPAKSGVSGAILLVVPNVMGLCLWSPPLDRQGNSVRGLQFCSEFVERFNLHNYDSLVDRKGSMPHSHSLMSFRPKFNDFTTSRSPPSSISQDSVSTSSGASQLKKQNHSVVNLLFSAHKNDLAALRRSYMSGFDMDSCDYDQRTALHVAAADGHLEAVAFLLRVCDVNPNPRDRWGFLPLDEAERFGHLDVTKILREEGAIASNQKQGDIESVETA